MDVAARTRLYTFLSRLFVKEIDDAFAEVLRSGFTQELLPDFWASDEVPALATADARARRFDPDFVNLTMVSVVPYESFYLRDDAMVESGQVNPLSAFLRSYGFEADLGAARSLSPDHVGIELELMAVLTTREAEAQAAGDAAYAATIRGVQRDFLHRHLLRWAPLFFLAVGRNAKTVLYRDGADAALHFLHADYEALLEDAKS